MVFSGLGDDFDLLFAEPFTQMPVSPDDPARDQVVGFAVLAKARIVVGGRRVDHVGIHVIIGGQIQSLLDHRQCMVALMPLVEGIVAGKDLRLYVCAQGGIQAVFQIFCHAWESINMMAEE